MSKKPKGLKGRETILLVDDDGSFRFALATELRAAGYLVVSAENGERGIRMIEGCDDPCTEISVVITDLIMPRKDGMKFCSEIRKIDKNIPILVITGFLSSEVERELQKIGCDDFLVKPFTPDELISKVETLLSQEDDVNCSKEDGGSFIQKE